MIFSAFAGTLYKQIRPFLPIKFIKMASCSDSLPGPQSFKLCANVDFMFTEHPSLLTRYTEAMRLGFRGIETGNPYGVTAKEIERILSGSAQQVLINTPIGSLCQGELGFASLPGKQETFLLGVQNAINYATTLNCKLVHIMAGLVLNNPIEEHDQVYIENLKKAAGKLEEANVVGVIEPINPHSVPKYYLNDYEKAVSVIKAVGSKNLGLLLDVFHLQQLKGDVTRNIKKYLPYARHVQVAQVPDRHEPDSRGELNYEHIFTLLNEEKYNGWVGLEYRPANKTENGLTWIKKYDIEL